MWEIVHNFYKADQNLRKKSENANSEEKIITGIF